MKTCRTASTAEPVSPRKMRGPISKKYDEKFLKKTPLDVDQLSVQAQTWVFTCTKNIKKGLEKWLID